MYNYIKGTVTEINTKNITIECNNLGYQIYTPNPFSFNEGDNIIVYTYLHVREDVMDLYGFKTRYERDFFFKLISVKGIGPKGALAILAGGDTSEIIQAIEAGNIKYLQKFPGIGPKASGQIILDLKGKLGNITPVDPKINDVKEALKSLGYNSQELKKLDKFLLDNKDLPIQELIKQSLKKLF
jgi:Holliday junction DNA helicase RuvA